MCKISVKLFNNNIKYFQGNFSIGEMYDHKREY